VAKSLSGKCSTAFTTSSAVPYRFTTVVAIASANVSESSGVVGSMQNGQRLLDLRTVFERDEAALLAAITRAASQAMLLGLRSTVMENSSKKTLSTGSQDEQDQKPGCRVSIRSIL
jgi:hypothetical protein